MACSGKCAIWACRCFRSTPLSPRRAGVPDAGPSIDDGCFDPSSHRRGWIIPDPSGDFQMLSRTAESSKLIYARVAGFTFLFYIAAGISSLALDDQKGVTDVLSLATS